MGPSRCYRAADCAVFAEIQLGAWRKSDDGGMRFSTETENCTDLKMLGGAEMVQKRCSFAALRRSGTKTGPFLVRYRGAVSGSRKIGRGNAPGKTERRRK